MTDPKWFQLPGDPYYNTRRENEIRAWEPGDGLVCSSAGRGRTSPIKCTAPAAVLISRDRRGDRKSVLCAIHVADVVRQLTRDQRNLPTIKTEAQKAARERVIAAHWDEYQEAITAELEKQKDQFLALLPESIRERVSLSNDVTITVEGEGEWEAKGE